MTTVPYSGPAGQLSYRREAEGGLAERPDFFRARIRDPELQLKAETHAAHSNIDNTFLASQVASNEAWSHRMRQIHGEAHHRIDAVRAVSPPKPTYVASYSPTQNGPPSPLTYM
eukprot:TRINITY_DN38081_c0_g1_i1.p1 TRINITY_DN38081_c0_g1~~TRINITY_DN38081_c0_g1_i1.p1  ORF type:complete len:131 (+),score=31.39 TRINITY_DN38081_c0_g1_i1:53-394(+)